MTVNELISIASNNLGDGGFVLMNRDEYIAFVNDVLMDLSFEGHFLLSTRQYNPTPGEYFYKIEDKDLISFVSVQLRSGTAVNIPEQPIYRDDITQQQLKDEPFSLDPTYAGATHLDVGEIAPIRHITVEFRRGRYYIHSATPFVIGDIIHGHVLLIPERLTWLDDDNLHSYPMIEKHDDNSPIGEEEEIWEQFRNLFIEGVTYRAARRHMQFSKTQSVQMLWQDSSQRYAQYLHQAKTFINKIKDSTIGLHILPFRYLEE